MKVFGERLKNLRQKRNLTQSDLGAIFKDNPKAQSTIGTWENGNREPSQNDLITIAKYFNTSTDYLLGLTDEEKTIDKMKEENPKELKDFLNKNKVLFNGCELDNEEKKRMVDILTGLFWENFTNK